MWVWGRLILLWTSILLYKILINENYYGSAAINYSPIFRTSPNSNKKQMQKGGKFLELVLMEIGTHLFGKFCR